MRRSCIEGVTRALCGLRWWCRGKGNVGKGRETWHCNVCAWWVVGKEWWGDLEGVAGCGVLYYGTRAAF